MARRKKSFLGGVLKFFAVIIAIGVVAFGAGYFLYAREVSGGVRPDGSVEVTIPMGASTEKIAGILKENDVIDNSLFFRLYSKTEGKDGGYQYGNFTLNPRDSYEKIIEELSTTAHFKETVNITIPEGYSIFQIAEAFEKTGLFTADEFIAAAEKDYDNIDFFKYIKEDELILNHLEGYLFPDTYQFYLDTTPEEAVEIMLKNFRKKALTDENAEKLKESGYTLNQWVTLASIIQRESANVDEMFNVASVFTNRLKNSDVFPKIESDTTNSYIRDYLYPFYNGKPTQEQVLAYDTYNKAGLPVGAIANPGEHALTATLNPNDTPYYFFVTDIEYNHYYGKTVAEHEANIRKALAVNKKYGYNSLVS